MVNNILGSTAFRHLPEGGEEDHGNFRLDSVPAKILIHNQYAFSHSAAFLFCHLVGYSVNNLLEAFHKINK
jgi:hypothetical protein